MKALLVRPPSFYMITTNVPDVVDQETGVYPPLGILYVAAYAREHSGWDISVLDAEVEKLDYDKLRRRIEDEQPDLVGIQCMSFSLIDVLTTIRLVKQIDPGIHVCLGGPHVNIYPEETMRWPEVDSLVLGEGEIPFTALLNSLKDGSDLSGVPGIAYRNKGRVIMTEQAGLIENLDILPPPARDLVPYENYYSVLAKERPISTMMTSRGCPFKCVFCDRPHLGKVFRAHSARYVVNEMEKCASMGIRELFLYDDTFSVDRKRALEICDEIERRGVDVAWDIRSRVDMVDKALLLRLRKAGLVRIHFGVESGNPEILRNLRKGITLKQIRNAFSWARETELTTLAYFMIGSPGEGKKEIMDSIRLAQDLDPDFVHFSITTPFPATELYSRALEQRVIDRDRWKEFAELPEQDFIPAPWEELFTREELLGFLRKAYRSFYARPGYIVKQTLKVRSMAEFLRKARAGLRIIRN